MSDAIRDAAQALLDAVDARHDQPAPLKYTVPYGAVNALRAALAAPQVPQCCGDPASCDSPCEGPSAGEANPTPSWIGDALRLRHGLSRPKRYPLVGEIVEVNGKIGVCTEYHKGWCYVRDMDDNWLDFIHDEDRHGPCGKTWRIRDDL